MLAWQQILSVIGVLGLLLLIAFGLNRRGWAQFSLRAGPARTRQIELVERVPLTPQHSLHLVRIAGRQLLIGVSPSGCNLLDSAAQAAEPHVSRRTTVDS